MRMVRRILSHSSGASNPDYLDSFEIRITPEELVGRIAAQPLQFEPGTTNAYSNAGYNLLASAIGKAARPRTMTSFSGTSSSRWR